MDEHRPGGPSRTLTVVRLAKVAEAALSMVSLTLNQYRLMAMISEGAPPAVEMCARLGVKQPNLSTLIDGLVSRGLLTRGRDPADRRRLVLALTEAGNELMRCADERCEATLRQLAGLAGAAADTEARFAALDAWAPALNSRAALVAAHQRLETEPRTPCAD